MFPSPRIFHLPARQVWQISGFSTSSSATLLQRRMESGLWVQQQIVIVLAPAPQVSREQLWNWKLGRTHNYPALPPGRVRRAQLFANFQGNLYPGAKFSLNNPDARNWNWNWNAPEKSRNWNLCRTHSSQLWAEGPLKKSNKQCIATDTIELVSNCFISDKLSPSPETCSEWILSWMRSCRSVQVTFCQRSTAVNFGQNCSPLLQLPR